MRRFNGRNRTLIDETGEQLHIAAAVAAEAVIAEHVRFVLQLVEEAGDRVPVERLLDAYARLHYLDDDEHRQLTERILVALGREPGTAPRARLRSDGSVLERAARRLRGRVDLELRGWVDRHTARAELAVLDVHVEHALRFVALLAEQATPDEAVELYAETLALRPTVAEMVRLRVLAEAPLPEGAEAEAPEIEPLHPRTPPTPRAPLRLAEDGG